MVLIILLLHDTLWSFVTPSKFSFSFYIIHWRWRACISYTTRTPSLWHSTCPVNHSVGFVNNVCVRDCARANVCVTVCVWLGWGVGGLRFCFRCLKLPCLFLFHVESTTLTWPWAVGWLCLLHASFIPPRTTSSICPPHPPPKPPHTHTYTHTSIGLGPKMPCAHRDTYSSL